jgi:hypothetical protein
MSPISLLRLSNSLLMFPFSNLFQCLCNCLLNHFYHGCFVPVFDILKISVLGIFFYCLLFIWIFLVLRKIDRFSIKSLAYLHSVMKLCTSYLNLFFQLHFSGIHPPGWRFITSLLEGESKSLGFPLGLC